MNYLFTVLLVIEGVVAGYWAIASLFHKERKRKIKWLIFSLGLSSAVWSLGFGVLFAVDSAMTAYLCRCVGMVGVFGYLISILFLCVGHQRKYEPYLKFYLLWEWQYILVLYCLPNLHII